MDIAFSIPLLIQFCQIATIATGHIHCWKIAGTHEAQQQCLARMRNATPTEGKIAGATSDHSTVCVLENPVHL